MSRLSDRDRQLLDFSITFDSRRALKSMTVNAGAGLWDAVQATPSRTELEIQLADGTKLKGRLLTATAGMVRLSLSDEIAEVQCDRVVKIYQLSPKPDELRRLLRNAGTITGVAAGLEIVKNKRAGFFLIPAVGGTLGAFGAMRRESHEDTDIIYDANPRQVAESPSSKPDKPQALTRPRTIDQHRRI